MGDLYGFATFYRYGWVNRRASSMNRHVCLGIPKGLSSHCFIESMMCIPVSIRDTPIYIIYIYIFIDLFIENYIDYIIIHAMCIGVCDIPIPMSMHPRPLQINGQLLAHPSRGGMTTTKSLEDFGMDPLSFLW